MGSLITIILIACVVYAVKSSKGRTAGQGQPPRPAQNTYRQPNQPRPMQNTYRQPNQPHPAQNTYRQQEQEPRPVRREQLPDEEQEIRLEEGIISMPETVLDTRSELMYQLEELMVMGYQAKLPYERDFLAEGMDMLTSVTSNE